MQQIYLDNAATAFPKAPGVSNAMKYYLDAVGANINRSVYGRAQEAGLTTLKLREQLKEFFSFPEKATHVLLTPGNTAGLNMVIKGLLHPGDHVLVSSMEHNAVMRPLLQLQGSPLTEFPVTGKGIWIRMQPPHWCAPTPVCAFAPMPATFQVRYRMPPPWANECRKRVSPSCWMPHKAPGIYPCTFRS